MSTLFSSIYLSILNLSICLVRLPSSLYSEKEGFLVFFRACVFLHLWFRNAQKKKRQKKKKRSWIVRLFLRCFNSLKCLKLRQSICLFLIFLSFFAVSFLLCFSLLVLSLRKKLFITPGKVQVRSCLVSSQRPLPPPLVVVVVVLLSIDSR